MTNDFIMTSPDDEGVWRGQNGRNGVGRQHGLQGRGIIRRGDWSIGQGTVIPLYKQEAKKVDFSKGFVFDGEADTSSSDEEEEQKGKSGGLCRF